MQSLSSRALKRFPEETVVRENNSINGARAELKQRKAELNKRIKSAKQVELDIQSIERTCELVSKNLTELSFENKRLALEALNIKVWINGGNIRIEGAIPITEDGVIATTRSLQRLSLAHPPSP